MIKRPYQGRASSFADPADVAAFRACKLRGNSDRYCFSFGDNGIGLWGDDTSRECGIAMCALPRDVWQDAGRGRGSRVRVKWNGKEIICELRDTLPSTPNVKHDVVIDLNPAAGKALGVKPPFLLEDVEWSWV